MSELTRQEAPLVSSETDPDAELKRLAREYFELVARHAAMQAEERAAYARRAEILGPEPAALRFAATDRAFLFDGLCSRPISEGEPFHPGEVELLRRFEGQLDEDLAAPGWRARRDEIVAAFDRWRNREDGLEASLGLPETWDRLEAIEADRWDLEQLIATVPARTAVGAIVKARVALAARWSEHLEDAAVRVAWSVVTDLAALDGGDNEAEHPDAALVALDAIRGDLEAEYQRSDDFDAPPELNEIEQQILHAPARTFVGLGVKVRQLRREAGTGNVGDYLAQFEQECQRILGYDRVRFYDGRDY